MSEWPFDLPAAELRVTGGRWGGFGRRGFRARMGVFGGLRVSSSVELMAVALGLCVSQSLKAAAFKNFLGCCGLAISAIHRGIARHVKGGANILIDEMTFLHEEIGATVYKIMTHPVGIEMSIKSNFRSPVNQIFTVALLKDALNRKVSTRRVGFAGRTRSCCSAERIL